MTASASRDPRRDEKLLKVQRKVQRLQEELTDKLRCVYQSTNQSID